MSLPLESFILKFNSLNVEVVGFVRNGLEYFIQVLSPNLALVKHLKYYKVYHCKNVR